MVTVKSKINGNVLTYIHVHRTGGASFQGALFAHPQLEVVCHRRPHLSAFETRRDFGRQIDVHRGYAPNLMMAVVRHPLPWLASQWALAEHPRHAGGGHVLNGRWPDFESFARDYPLTAPGYRFQHPLVRDFMEAGGVVLPDALYRFESALGRSWHDAETFLGVEIEQRHMNEALEARLSVDEKATWRDYYDADLESYVLTAFADDLELWNEARA